MKCMHVMCKGLQTLLCFSSCHIKTNPEKAAISHSVFHHFFSSAYWLCVLYQDTLQQTCKAQKGEARRQWLRSFTKMWMAPWPPFLPSSIYFQPCWQNNSATILIISFSLLKSPSILPLPHQDKVQAPQHCKPEPCPLPSSISLVAPYTVHTVSQPFLWSFSFSATPNHKSWASPHSFTWWTPYLLELKSGTISRKTPLTVPDSLQHFCAIL